MSSKLAYKIAWRYIFSRKSTNAINWISAVSMFGIGVGSAALIIVLSGFNGFEDLVKRLYSAFYPDISVIAAEGKSFSQDAIDLNAIRAVPGVQAVSLTLEENAIVVYDEEEHIAVVKGVDNRYADVTAVDDSVIIGRFRLVTPRPDSTFIDCAVLGAGVAQVLGIRLGPHVQPLSIYMPRRGSTSGLNQARAFKRLRALPTGVFRIQQEFDARFVIVPLAFMQELLEYDDRQIGAIEVKLAAGSSSRAAVRRVRGIVGDSFEVRNRYQQNAAVYRVMRTEKWFVYIVLTFIPDRGRIQHDRIHLHARHREAARHRHAPRPRSEPAADPAGLPARRLAADRAFDGDRLRDRPRADRCPARLPLRPDSRLGHLRRAGLSRQAAGVRFRSRLPDHRRHRDARRVVPGEPGGEAPVCDSRGIVSRTPPATSVPLRRRLPTARSVDLANDGVKGEAAAVEVPVLGQLHAA